MVSDSVEIDFADADDHHVDTAQLRNESQLFGNALQMADQHDFDDAAGNQSVDAVLHGWQHVFHDHITGASDRRQLRGYRADNPDVHAARTYDRAGGNSADIGQRLQAGLASTASETPFGSVLSEFQVWSQLLFDDC